MVFQCFSEAPSLAMFEQIFDNLKCDLSSIVCGVWFFDLRHTSLVRENQTRQLSVRSIRAKGESSGEECHEDGGGVEEIRPAAWVEGCGSWSLGSTHVR